MGPNATSFTSTFTVLGDYNLVYVKYIYLVVYKAYLLNRGG